uniref:Uncharacterized protein n=1 Tax=Nelumbo nucifera TaxID=4432 RepID=A0A822YXD4_NELNU|nr:TPA_asm: hypothetical protein HUJ06_012749 [Nelumbo nucifera]
MKVNNGRSLLSKVTNKTHVVRLGFVTIKSTTKKTQWVAKAESSATVVKKTSCFGKDLNEVVSKNLEKVSLEKNNMPLTKIEGEHDADFMGEEGGNKFDEVEGEEDDITNKWEKQTDLEDKDIVTITTMPRALLVDIRGN